MTLRNASLSWFLLTYLLIGTGFSGFFGCAEESEEQSSELVGSDSIQGEANDRGSDAGTGDPADTAERLYGETEGTSGRLYLHHAKETVGRSIPSVLISSVEVDGSAMLVKLKQNEEIPAYVDYYEVADQRNRIVAIESIRWFRDLPSMQMLHLQIPSPEGTKKYALDRDKVAEFYEISFDSLSENRDEKYWRENFLVRGDNDEERARFADTFTTK